MKSLQDLIIFSFLLVLGILGFNFPNNKDSFQATRSEGPSHGHLLIVGGKPNVEIWDKLKELMGGADQELVVIPTAASSDSLDDTFLNNYKSGFNELGFSNVAVLHTHSRSKADSEEFIVPLKTAKAVWFSGGRQWRHADAYLHTRTHEALWEVLERGGVIAGNSAGATIQGSYLARGDTKANTIMVGDHEEGLGFLTNVAIDQHLLARNRQFDMFEILSEYPHLLGIGIDEYHTAVVVHKNRLRVIGESYVAIYDGTRWSEERDTIYPLPKGSKEFYFLSAGDEYDLWQRKIVTFADRKFMTLTTDEIERLRGVYRSPRNADQISIYFEHDTLRAHQSWDNVRYPVLAESPKRLFIPNTNISFDFLLDPDGRVSGFKAPAAGRAFTKIK